MSPPDPNLWRWAYLGSDGEKRHLELVVGPWCAATATLAPRGGSARLFHGDGWRLETMPLSADLGPTGMLPAVVTRLNRLDGGEGQLDSGWGHIELGQPLLRP